jgi:hypothetical protein
MERSFDLSWLCLPLSIAPVLVVAVLATRAKLSWWNRHKHGTPTYNSTEQRRMKILAAVAFFSIAGAIIVLCLFFLPATRDLPLPSLLLLLPFAFFVLVGGVAGFLLERAVRRGYHKD